MRLYSLRPPESRLSPSRYRLPPASNTSAQRQQTTITSSVMLRTQQVHAASANPDQLDPYVTLPFDRVTWQDQGEIPSAVPIAILFGRMNKKKADVWIYLSKTTPSIIFHSYFLDGRPDRFLIIDEVLQHATPAPAFELASSPTKLLALTMYYFIRKDLAKNNELSLTTQMEADLRLMCNSGGAGTLGVKRSKVVVLRVRFLEKASTAQKAETKEQAQYSETCDKGSAKAATSLDTSPAHCNNSGAIDAEPASIDRYLDLEDQDHCIHKELDRYDVRIHALRTQLNELQKRLNKEETEATKLVLRKEEGEKEKKRLWNAMSKEDVRQLGRSDMERKRQKTG